jgi:cell wall-associated NlpC family hydrolase
MRAAMRAGIAPVASAPGRRRLRGGLGVTAAVGAAIAVTVAVTATPTPALHRPPGHRSVTAANGATTRALQYASLLDAIGTRPAGSAVAQATAARARLGETEVAAAQKAGLTMPAGGVVVPAGITPTTTTGAAAGPGGQQLPPVGPAQEPDLFVIAPQTLPPAAVLAIGRLPGVAAVNQLDAARLEVGGSSIATLGVDPVTFRQFAATPTATSTALWQNVAAGDIAVSYLMGEQKSLPLGGLVTVTGAKTERLPVGGFGTVGITGVDAVVSDSVARSLGMPAGNGLVVSAPHARLSVLMSAIQKLVPGGTVAPLVAQAAETASPASAGWAGVTGIAISSANSLTVPQTRTFLEAALSRLGYPYVWGGSGPTVFDCSGLVQWSLRQAGVVMPRVAAQQAETGPLVPPAQLQPGDLLFYHTDPTAPSYISHVAIYLGSGLMVQAPEPGKNVEVVPADFGAGFAGAIRIDPQLAAAVAG